MTGSAHRATAYFELARQHFDSENAPRLALYLLNITALARLRSGDAGGALALEDEIELRLQDPRRRDWHLIYINCLNLARIYKKLGALDHAARYYRRAFYVTSSARSESDLLYMNLCQAQLEALRGNTAAVLSNWLRATIHWLSDPLPEALAPRVAQAVLGKPLNDCGADVEQISAALNRALGMAAARHDIAFVPLKQEVGFARLTRRGQADVCVAHDDWALALSWQEIAPSPFVGTQYSALKRTVAGLLAALVPEVDFTGVRGLLADSRCGSELPATVREACWSCWRYDVRELIHAGQHYRILATDDFLTKFVVQLSAAIHSIAPGGAHLRITFKRYLAPIELESDECSIVEYLDTPRTIAQLAQSLGRSPHDCAAIIRSLEDKRVVVIG